MALSLTPRSRATWAADFPLLSTSFTASSLNSLVDTFWTFATSDPFPICLSLSHPWGLCQVGARLHRLFAETLESCYGGIRGYQQEARTHGFSERPRWPLIVLRTPKGWTGPREVDGVQIEGTFRSHQVPVADVQKKPEHLHILEDWLKSYHPETLFDGEGRLLPELAALAPAGDYRMSANPHANGGALL